VIVVAVFTGLVTLFGYRVMHGYGRLSSVLCGIVFIYLTVRLLTTSRLGAVFANEHFSASAFLLVISIMATWQITYAPYVADYSRYLPRNVAARATFWWTFAGSVGGTVWLMCFGAIAAAGVGSALENNDVSYVVGLSDHGVAQVVYPILIVGIIATNMLNLYEAFMSTATTLNAVARFRLTPVRRAALICAATIAGTLIAVIGRTNFLNNYSSFLGFLMYFMIPWTAINLIDFYVLRHANYRTEAFFERHGEYGLINVRTMTAFVAAIVLQIPFVNTTFYVGPMAHLFGGADVAWMVGLVVAAVLYYALMAGRVRRSASVGRTSTVLRGTR
jgi:NCS1 family nucleobase:cation symporter-1